MKRIDLNVDIGEGFPYDEALLAFATSANVCCGGYAGSPDLTRHTVELCRQRGVRVGAHPGYPDPAGFGRRSAEEAGADPIEWAVRTCESFRSFFESYQPEFLKPHGALYNESAQPLSRVEGIGPVSSGSSAGMSLDWLRQNNLAAWTVGMMLNLAPCPLLGMGGTSHESLSVFATCKLSGQRFIREGFADRRYRPDGTLVPRTAPRALLEDPEEIRAQVLALAERVDSICLHGDNPHCLEFAEMVHRTLVDHGYEVGT